MLIIQVSARIKSHYIGAFSQATQENARHSVLEPGIARFDIIQQIDDPARFLLIEVYRTEEDPALHKETAHYKKWRETVEPMMAEPRTSKKYHAIFPDEQGWG